MTASDALMLPELSTSVDQVQARYGECVSTGSLHAHTVTLYNNHMIRDSLTSISEVSQERLTGLKLDYDVIFLDWPTSFA